MSATIEAYAAAWRPRDRRTMAQWVTENVRVPNMARGSHLDLSACPWQAEVFDFMGDARTREMVVLWPTGAGKSNIVDGASCHHAAENEGNALLAVQGNAEAQKYVEGRLLPALKNIPKVADDIASMPRHSIKKGEIGLPGKYIYWGGANETNAQATSCRLVVVDEAWMADHGLLEQFRARLHNRWNRLFVALGQGGMAKLEVHGQMVDTEWNAAWLRTDQREWCFVCPQCGEEQRYRLRGLKYDRPGDDSAEWDETAIGQSARYECIGVSREKQACDAVFPDKVNIRRDLCRTGRYVVQHPKHRAHHHGWHTNALGIWYETWYDMAILHANAHRARKLGDEEPMKLMRQKRMAEHVRKEQEIQQTTLTKGDYSLEDYFDGKLRLDGEILRCGFADRQREHYRVVCRAWRADGSSRRIYRGRINTENQLRDLQQRLNIPDKWFAVDSGKFTDEVYNLCAKYGWRAFKGDHAESYRFSPPNGKSYWKFFSPMKAVAGSAGKSCMLILFSNLQVKRIVERLRNGPQKIDEDGEGNPIMSQVPVWEVEKDITQEAIDELHSEIEKDTRSPVTGKWTRAFVPVSRTGNINKRRPNHEWDGEVGCAVFALIGGALAYQPEQKAPAPASPAPVNAD